MHCEEGMEYLSRILDGQKNCLGRALDDNQLLDILELRQSQASMRTEQSSIEGLSSIPIIM